MNMPNDDRVREGYLLLADISGYTAFLTGTELEHAQAIIRELTKLIRSRLAPPMKFVKLEGDAVFCYADGAVFQMVAACGRLALVARGEDTQYNPACTIPCLVRLF